MSTDCERDAHTILHTYAKRWGCEGEYLYLKTGLGLSAFRLRSVEGITKYFARVFWALGYLQYRLALETSGQVKTLADVITRHRDEHGEQLVMEACQRAMKTGSLQPVYEEFLRKSA